MTPCCHVYENRIIPYRNPHLSYYDAIRSNSEMMFLPRLIYVCDESVMKMAMYNARVCVLVLSLMDHCRVERGVRQREQ